METKTKKPKTEKVEKNIEKRFIPNSSEYETASQVRSLNENGEVVSAETKKIYKLLIRALSDETEN